MKDQVSIELLDSNFDQTLADYFSNLEQFWLNAKDQDFDLDTCMELCDHVALLNEELTAQNSEEKTEIARTELEFEHVQKLDTATPEM
ncbi:LANO_0H15962g1_1 [Lachancea nothofagi CBS 11611]|uniref:LANO_0H15962g1_1 n=1 Tax=Lachancea nothofagi CBS 11611 TaxID=1266666 RepID=A0A1G4KMT4_9SACH|nr:LANO_0H15962g1_1 [Lachancea nothofagi CBS 11611]